jgi:hypothetical protein
MRKFLTKITNPEERFNKGEKKEPKDDPSKDKVENLLLKVASKLEA